MLIDKLGKLLHKAQCKNAMPQTAKAVYDGTRSDAALDTLLLALSSAGRLREAQSILRQPHAARLMTSAQKHSSVMQTFANVSYELADYRDVIQAIDFAKTHDSEALRFRLDFLKAAFAASILDERAKAMEYFARQYLIVPDNKRGFTEADRDRLIRTIFLQVDHTITPLLEYEERKLGRDLKVAVMFFSSTEALGHAILDPYHFIAQQKDNFDKIILIGPPRASYRPASATCLEIVEQYATYVETESDLLLNLSWMAFESMKLGNVTMFANHYRQLLRQSCHKTRCHDDPFAHNNWHFQPPPEFKEIAESFCAIEGIDIARPLVVLHARDSGYHRIAAQSYRDANIDAYKGAVEYLLNAGYQVIRIGDRRMPKLRVNRDDYFELPFLDNYSHELDSYLISKARFMIGCQSGPCSYARAFGVPILSINAVLHYTLLPSTQELACFKKYFRKHSDDGGERQLTLEEAMELGCYHFDNNHQFEQARIRLENAEPKEILLAVKDMISWLENGDLPETPEQLSFAAFAETTARTLEESPSDLYFPIGDYLGVSLPGYRVSPSVEQKRRVDRDTSVALPAKSDSGDSDRKQVDAA